MSFSAAPEPSASAEAVADAGVGVDVSIVIPAYNEARRLPATLAGWRDFLGAKPYRWEILVVDDGSADATSEVAAAAGARVIRLNPNQGKGGAVRAGVLAANGRYIAYADADMNVAPSHLQEALRRLEPTNRAPAHPQKPLQRLEPADTQADSSVSNLQHGSHWLEACDVAGESSESHRQKARRRLEDGSPADLVAGQRDLAQYATAEGPLRLLAGGLVQATRRLVVMSAIRDTQCGFKVFRRDLSRAIFTRTRVRSFAFDIEVLFLARKFGARIVELPVSTTYRADSTFSVRRHLPQFLKDIVWIRVNDLLGRYAD